MSLCWPIWENNLKRSGYLYVCNWLTLLYTWNEHNTINQLYSSKIKKKQDTWLKTVNKCPLLPVNRTENFAFAQPLSCVMSNSLRPHGREPARLLYLWDFPDWNPGVGSQFPSPGDLPDTGNEPASPALAGRLSPTEPPRKPESAFTCIFFRGGLFHQWHIC